MKISLIKTNLFKKINLKSQKPLFGKSRSFSNKATSRKFKLNKQKITIGDKRYCLPVKVARTIKFHNISVLNKKK